MRQHPVIVKLGIVACPWCGGEGVLRDLPDPPPVPRGDEMICPACHGTGRIEVALVPDGDGFPSPEWCPVGDSLTEEAATWLAGEEVE